jgi:hypothetical protein
MLRIFFRFSSTENFKRGNKIGRGSSKSFILIASYPDQCVLSSFPTLSHPRSSDGVISSAHRDSFSFLFT